MVWSTAISVSPPSLWTRPGSGSWGAWSSCTPLGTPTSPGSHWSSSGDMTLQRQANRLQQPGGQRNGERLLCSPCCCITDGTVYVVTQSELVGEHFNVHSVGQLTSGDWGV